MAAQLCLSYHMKRFESIRCVRAQSLASIFAPSTGNTPSLSTSTHQIRRKLLTPAARTLLRPSSRRGISAAFSFVMRRTASRTRIPRYHCKIYFYTSFSCLNTAPIAQTAQALGALQTRKRVLLSGTPIQNDLDEFYSMVHFANPWLLGSERDFHRDYQNPILRGREPDATERDRERAEIKSTELGRIVNQFILRRCGASHISNAIRSDLLRNCVESACTGRTHCYLIICHQSSCVSFAAR